MNDMNDYMFINDNNNVCINIYIHESPLSLLENYIYVRSLYLLDVWIYIVHTNTYTFTSNHIYKHIVHATYLYCYSHTSSLALMLHLPRSRCDLTSSTLPSCAASLSSLVSTLLVLVRDKAYSCILHAMQIVVD